MLQVISPEVDRCVLELLDKMNFVTIITDTSNRKSDKMLPILVRGFTEEGGVRTLKLAVKFIKGETSETIGNEVVETGKVWRVEKKIVAFGKLR